MRAATRGCQNSRSAAAWGLALLWYLPTLSQVPLPLLTAMPKPQQGIDAKLQATPDRSPERKPKNRVSSNKDQPRDWHLVTIDHSQPLASMLAYEHT